jgi:hypothetical protein
VALPSDAPANTKDAAPPPRDAQTHEEVADDLSFEEQRRERIRKVTAQGGLTALPVTFGDTDGDWQLIRAKDPFEVLYLDYRQHATITEELITRHVQLIEKFWSDKLASMRRGAAGLQIRAQYPGIETFPATLARAAQRLRQPGGIQAEVKKLDDARFAAGKRAADDMIDLLLSDGVMSVEESKTYFAKAAQHGLTPGEAADILQSAYTRRGLIPTDTPVGPTLAERLRSVKWTIPGHVERTPGVIPFKYSHGSAGSLSGLITLADQFPDETEQYLFHGYFETWLTKNLADAKLALEARDIQQRYARERSHGVEMFMRALCRRAGISDRPALVASPPVIDFGLIPMGARDVARVEIRNTNNRRAWGTITCNPALPGVSIPTQFSSDEFSIDVELDTLTVPAGNYWGEVIIAPVGCEPSIVLVRYTVVALELVAEPAMLPLGNVMHGTRVTHEIRVGTAPPGGRLVGTVVVSPPLPGVSVSSEAKGDAFRIQVEVDNTRTPAGRYVGRIEVRTNAGALDIPFAQRVTLRTNVVVRWTVGSALGAGFLMAAARLMLSSGAADFRQWYLDTGYTSSDAKGYGLVFGIAICAVVWGLLGRPWFGRKRRA